MIPVKDSIKYLPSLIESIRSQSYTDYELIISDDHSVDGTSEYIDSLSFPNLLVLHTKNELLVSEHFDWVQSHASGDWQMFIGGDDAVMPYFFDLADKLTTIADRKGIRTIATQRSYFFWPGAEFQNLSVSFNFDNSIEIRRTKKYMKKCLLDNYSYHNCPTMYTTSLFKKDLLDQIRVNQNGKLVPCPVSDATLASLGLLYNKYYLYSRISLSWVGTSPKAIYRDTKTLKKLELPKRFGDYCYGRESIYLWMGLLTCDKFLHVKSKFDSKFFLYKFFYRELKYVDSGKWNLLQNICNENGVDWNVEFFIYNKTRVFLKCFLFVNKVIGFVNYRLRLLKVVISKLLRKENFQYCPQKQFQLVKQSITYDDLRDKVSEIYANCQLKIR